MYKEHKIIPSEFKTVIELISYNISIDILKPYYVLL